jgi:hypothetical protein
VVKKYYSESLQEETMEIRHGEAESGRRGISRWVSI